MRGTGKLLGLSSLNKAQIEQGSILSKNVVFIGKNSIIQNPAILVAFCFRPTDLESGLFVTQNMQGKAIDRITVALTYSVNSD